MWRDRGIWCYCWFALFMSPCCQCLSKFMLNDFVSGLTILARVQLILEWLCFCSHCFNNVQLILCWLLVPEWLWFWSHYFSKVPFDSMSIVNLCLCSHCFKVQLIMCFCSHCFRSNWFCIYDPTILNPIECVFAFILLSPIDFVFMLPLF